MFEMLILDGCWLDHDCNNCHEPCPWVLTPMSLRPDDVPDEHFSVLLFGRGRDHSGFAPILPSACQTLSPAPGPDPINSGRLLLKAYPINLYKSGKAGMSKTRLSPHLPSQAKALRPSLCSRGTLDTAKPSTAHMPTKRFLIASRPPVPCCLSYKLFKTSRAVSSPFFPVYLCGVCVCILCVLRVLSVRVFAFACFFVLWSIS